jgi:hypothetical protein
LLQNFEVRDRANGCNNVDVIGSSRWPHVQQKFRNERANESKANPEFA